MYAHRQKKQTTEEHPLKQLMRKLPSHFKFISFFCLSVIGESEHFAIAWRHFCLSRPEGGRAGGSTPTGRESFSHPPTLERKNKRGNSEHVSHKTCNHSRQDKLHCQGFLFIVCFLFFSPSATQRLNEVPLLATYANAERVDKDAGRRSEEGGGFPPMNRVNKGSSLK